MGCFIKEEIDIPFVQDEYFMDQHVLCEESLADSMTAGHPTSFEDNKDDVFRLINIKNELSEDMIRLQHSMDNMGDINKEPSETEPQSMKTENVTDEYFMDQHVLCEESLADSMTAGHPTGFEDNKDDVFRLINIKNELSEDMIRLQHSMGNMGDINKEPSETEPQSMKTENDVENDVDITADADLQAIIDDLRINGGEVPTESLPATDGQQLTKKDEDKPDKIVEEKKTVEKRVLREKKAKKSEAGGKKPVENQSADRRELRKRKAKDTTTAEPPKKKKNSRVESSTSSFIRQQCPNCEFTLEDGLRALSVCSKCQTLCVYACVECSKQFDRKASVKNHVDTICDPRQINYCRLCEYTSTRYDNMKTHVLKTHKAKVANLSTLIETINLRT